VASATAATGGKPTGQTPTGAEGVSGEKAEHGATPGTPMKHKGEDSEQDLVPSDDAQEQSATASANKEEPESASLEPVGAGLIARLPFIDTQELNKDLQQLVGEVESLSNLLFSNQAVLLWLSGVATAGLACELARRQLRRTSPVGVDDPSPWWLLGAGAKESTS
jgi:hypothetical protein